jgi:hypothetical protein
MSKGNTFESDLLSLILNNVNCALVGDATGLRGSSTPGSLFVSLHTADPGEAGSQTTSEANYTSYARVAIARSGSAWTVTNGTAVNAGAVTFPAATGGTNTITHFAVGTDVSGTGKILYKGALSSPSSLVVSSGITPAFAIGQLSIAED